MLPPSVRAKAGTRYRVVKVRCGEIAMVAESRTSCWDDETEYWLTKAAKAGDWCAISWLAGCGRDPERWWRQFAADGNIYAMMRLADLLSDKERVDEAVKWYQRVLGADQRAIDAGVTEISHAMKQLVEWLDEHRCVEEAESWYQ